MGQPRIAMAVQFSHVRTAVEVGNRLTVTKWDTAASLGGLGVAVLTGVLVGLALVGLVKRNRCLVGAIGGALTFQVVHLFEHVAQAAYWIWHQTSPAYLTPWASSARSGLAFWCHVWPGKGAATARGNELLHLAGNSIFLVGAAAMVIMARRMGSDQRGLRGARQCAWLQTFHVAEHVSLTATLFVGGVARGVSTLLGGLAATDPALVGYRVWWHFAMNLVVTLAAIRAIQQLVQTTAFDVDATVLRNESPARTASSAPVIAISGATWSADRVPSRD